MAGGCPEEGSVDVFCGYAEGNWVKIFCPNCSEAIVAFQIEYSHAIGQYSAVSMVVVVKFL